MYDISSYHFPMRPWREVGCYETMMGIMQLKWIGGNHEGVYK